MDVEQALFDRAADAVATVATDSTNKTLVTITVRNANGRPMAVPTMFDLWLCDVASGFGVTAVTASGAVAGKTDGTTGKDISVFIASKSLRVQTTAAGTYQLSITDTAKTPFLVFVSIGIAPVKVATLVTASYG
jgi:hypothetical protein